jgi:hypothetical protein
MTQIMAWREAMVVRGGRKGILSRTLLATVKIPKRVRESMWSKM